MDRYGYIYKTTNLINNKIYIGQHRYNGKKIDNTYYGSGKIIKLAIEKNGIKNFKCEIIENAKTKEELNIKEKKWIKYYQDKGFKMYNITSGGDGGDTNKGKKFSKEWKDKNLLDVIYDSMSAREEPLFLETSTMGTIRESVFDNEYEYATDIINGYEGKSETIDETVLPIIYELDNPNEWQDEKKWYIDYPDLKERISKAHKGQKSWCKGLTKENNKIVKTRSLKISKKIRCIEKNKIYNSLYEAGNDLEITAGAICMALKGKTKTAKGYHWEYI